MTQIFRWKEKATGPDHAIYLNRHVLTGPYVDVLHYQDYAELLYAREGEVTHILNGQAERFKAGELIFIRPSYHHQMRLEAGEHFSYDVIAMQPNMIRHLLKRYATVMTGFWDMRATEPMVARLTKPQSTWLDANVRELAANPTDQFLVERFILNLAYEVYQTPVTQEADMPEWLMHAIHQLEDIELSKQGPRVLATLTGRSFEHVCRVLKQTSGLTPSTIVNAKRIEHAASQLLLTDDPIVDIAFVCGFQSLGHFYKEFGKQYGQSPRQYRVRHGYVVKGV